MNVFDDVSYIRQRVPIEELLAGLAEEAAELAQAALKYRRTFSNANPTPMTAEEAMVALDEEVADVALYLGTAGLIRDIVFSNEKMASHVNEKLNRWKSRLTEQAKETENETR